MKNTNLLYKIIEAKIQSKVDEDKKKFECLIRSFENHVKKVSFDTAVKQNKLRQRQVPDDVIKRQLDGWQDPDSSEGIDKIVNV